MARKGRTVESQLDRLKEYLDKNGEIAICLDVFDQLRDKDQVVYDLYQTGVEADSYAGLVMVSNNNVEAIDLDARNSSRLSLDVLTFDPYDREEVKRILRALVPEAFKKGAIDQDVIRYITDQAVERGGDCRYAVEMLRRAGRVAARKWRSATLNRWRPLGRAAFSSFPSLMWNAFQICGPVFWNAFQDLLSYSER